MDSEIRPVEIKDLNKTQLILLAILLSFVVSVATGIVTVTLMQQASPAVNQTINRVVQRTIEKVVPDYTPNKVQTVVVKEDDMVVDAVSKTRANIFPILLSKDSTDRLGDAYSIGDGNFISASVSFDSSKTYSVKNGDGFLNVKVSGISPLGFALLTVDPADASSKNLPKSSFGKDSDARPGETAILIDGKNIGKGIIESVVGKDEKDKDGKIISKWNLIDLNISVSKENSGSLVADLDGDVVGIVTLNNDDTAQIIGADALTNFIATPTKPVPLQANALGGLNNSASTTNSNH